MTTKRSLLLAGMIVALACGIAGCGGQPFPEAQTRPIVRSTQPARKARARLLAAVERATAAHSARLRLDMKLSSDLTNAKFSGSGVIDFAHGQSMLHLVGHGPGTDVASSLELRVVGRTAYFGQAGRWTTMPLDARAASSGIPDPTSYLTYLQDVADDVHVDGHEMLRGDDTTRYVATIDFARAAPKSGGTEADRAVVRSVMALMGDLRIPVTVWVDAHGRLRQLTMKIDFSSIATRLGAPEQSSPVVEVTMELYDFGVAVHVPVPTGAKSVAAIAQDRAAQSDLRNAITAEKTMYIDGDAYTADPFRLKEIEPSLDWGGKLAVVVSSQEDPVQVVCLSERSKSGTSFALADVASGPNAGTYYATKGCPTVVDGSSFSDFATRW